MQNNVKKKYIPAVFLILLLLLLCSCGRKNVNEAEQVNKTKSDNNASQAAVTEVLPPEKEETKTETAESLLCMTALKYIGTPYKAGGDTPDGFDCSGLVFFCFNETGVKLSARSSQDMYDASERISEKDLKPGDLVFFKGTYDTDKVSHVGIYNGNGQMIHAGTKAVETVDLSDKYWTEHFYAYGRIE